MIAHIFDEVQFHVNNHCFASWQIENSEECIGLPQKQGVKLYIIRPMQHGRTEGLMRLEMTAVEAHKLSQALELYARALSGKFTTNKAGDT